VIAVSINLLHGGVSSGLTGRDWDLDRRLDLVAEELRRLDADLVGVQEASTGRGRGDVAARLASRLGMQHTFAPALFELTPFSGLNRFIAVLMNFREGPAILSRFPIVRSEVRRLPRCGGIFDPRVAIAADVSTPWGELPVFSTHLSWGACQAEDLAEFVLARRRALPGVLMGDFNAVESSPAIRHLVEDGGLVDTFRVVRPDDPGFTVWQRPWSDEPSVSRRVDFVFLVPGLDVAGRVLESRIVLDSPVRLADGDLLWPSDHYGVLAELEIASPDRR
jgi:endonuclease/exonuclease/phosphatase family metal-dependent hydrolase